MDPILTNKENLVGDVKVKRTLAALAKDSGVQDPERRKVSKNRVHSPRPQESRSWPPQRSA